MKKLILLLAVCVLFGLKGYSQFAFGVSPGLSTNAAYFGLKMNKVVPYIGFQMAHIGVNTDYVDHYFNGTDFTNYEESYKLSANLYVPEIGVKFFAIEKNNLKGYFNLSLTKPMIRGKVEYDEEEAEEFGDMLKEIKLWGGEFGFGAEYFFDDNFSIGGEFGIRYMHAKFEQKDDYDYNGEPAYEKETYKINLSPTYSKISLNFYFGGGKSE